ncbi:10817_t:CDS:2 [Racocetra fulgida]|uniref:10817_t:CDS:1 n=1 Tax=Racocetra fulgida TaxID=60492 RepID=A0A9N8WA46_9GLOM|nr:10817_t:CDS:2 [Racocetra fulgida]
MKTKLKKYFRIDQLLASSSKLSKDDAQLINNKFLEAISQIKPSISTAQETDKDETEKKKIVEKRRC